MKKNSSTTCGAAESWRSDRRLVALVFALSLLILIVLSYLVLIYAINGRSSVSLTAATRGLLPAAWRIGSVKYSVPTVNSAPTTAVHFVEPQTWPVRRVPILMYHLIRNESSTAPFMERAMSVSPDLFKQEMTWLKDNGYQTISFDEFVAYASSIAPLPPKPIIISFDDGSVTQYREAFPVLQSLGLKATFFVVTDYLGTKKASMTWDEVHALDRAGMAIGSHTRTHPYVNRLKDMKKVWDEIVGSKQIIEKKLGHAISTFAYPWGGYDEYLEKLCRDNGYTAARGAQKGIATTADNRYTLKAITVLGDMKRFQFLLNSQ